MNKLHEKIMIMKYLKKIIAIFALTIIGSAYAQDGEGLFKAKCSTCHGIDKNSTGPALKGVKQKWVDASEEAMIYDWIMNSASLIASGKSTRATEAKEFSPIEMPAQDVSKEDIDAILTYVDNYTEAPPKDDTSLIPDGEKEVKIVPNYDKNLKTFYFLIFVCFVLLIAIFILSGSLVSLIKIERRKNQNGGNSIKNVLMIIGIFGAIAAGNSSRALSFMAPGDATEKSPWLLVEDSDLYLMIIINVILLVVLFYLRRMFNEVMSMLRPEAQKARVSKRKRRINKVLTDTVPVEEEASILMKHEYDGIQELDNNLPPWWLWGFYGTIVFAVIYLFNYHIFKTADLQDEEYAKSMAKAKIEVEEYRKKNAMNVDETNATLMTEDKDLSAGKTLFDANCVSCHNADGGGNIGPNLTDNAWIYGFDVKEVFKTVSSGTPNGMPAHNTKMNPIQVQQVASYVLSLPETKAGKEAQGDIIEK